MRKKRLLLVDDVQLFLEQQKSFLAREDFELTFARSGSEAVRLAAEIVPDLILMDLYMPDIDGDRCCRTLKSMAELNEVPVIMITSGVHREDFERCWQAGCDDIILKPINLHYFLAIIKKYLPVKERTVQRYVARLQVFYGQDQETLLDDYSINVSTGGLFIETFSPLPEGSRLGVSFSLPNDEADVRCQGKVAWINHPEMLKNPSLPAGMGIQFLDLSLDDMGRIRQFIKEKALLPMW
jgi:uncharacterized protein (TIGR02266 family)